MGWGRKALIFAGTIEFLSRLSAHGVSSSPTEILVYHIWGDLSSGYTSPRRYTMACKRDTAQPGSSVPGHLT